VCYGSKGIEIWIGPVAMILIERLVFEAELGVSLLKMFINRP
jgi:hypothetical protein